MNLSKRMMSILLACLMLTSMLSTGVFAAGTQEEPIDASTKWFGYGVDTYLLNPTIAEGSNGLWYTLTAEQAGVLFLEHSYKNVDYTITITLNGETYVGGCVNGEPYNRPIVTAPIAVGDVATIQIATKDAASGTVYANMNIITCNADNTIKVKSDGLTVVIGAGETLYFQDDSLNAIYATKGLLVTGDVTDTTFYTVTKNSESGAVVKKAVVDSDEDGIIEAKLGGSLGSPGAPPIKPAWAIENGSDRDQQYTLTIADTAHECVYDDDADADCNSCGAVRELPCQHAYDHDFDEYCNLCSKHRDVTLPLNVAGTSISVDVNGLAWLVKADVKGIALKNGCEIDYTNATVGNYKLIKMGAVVTNTQDSLSPLPKLEDVNGDNVLNIEAKYLYTLNEDGTTSYAIRVIDIPEHSKDSEIAILTYFIFEDEAGQEQVLYCNSALGAYNWFV